MNTDGPSTSISGPALESQGLELHQNDKFVDKNMDVENVIADANKKFISVELSKLFFSKNII
jgi:hypothetical protein